MSTFSQSIPCTNNIDNYLVTIISDYKITTQHRDVGRAGQAKLDPKHYLIKYVGS